MHRFPEGEILLKEKYGATSREIYYVKPPSQSNVVILEKKIRNITNLFKRLFLPQGYPDSVSKDYVSYQIWDTAQAFCSTITGTLATQEVLRGVGVGDTNATPLAATIMWVIKDGCGHLGRILFAFSHGTYLDAYSKKWRLYADILNDAAMCMEIALPMLKNYTMPVLCVSTVMKAIVGVAGGATRAAMTQHHAIRGNMADVSAKDSAQETAVNLVASLTALMIISLFGDSMFVFGTMIILHILFNYMAVRAVCLKTFNEPRLLLTIDFYLRKELIAAPNEINQIEPIVFYQLGPNLLDLKLCGFYLKLGYSITKFMRENPNAYFLKSVIEMHSDQRYIVIPNVNKRVMYMMLKDNATTDDILCAYFHSVLLAIIICAINDDALMIYHRVTEPRPFAQVCHTLQAAEWSREPNTDSITPLNAFTYKPSLDLLNYVNKIARNEWLRIRGVLLKTGWDLSKHLLMVDEWRVSKDIPPIPISQQHIEATSSDTLRYRKPFSELLEDYKEKRVDKRSIVIEPEEFN